MSEDRRRDLHDEAERTAQEIRAAADEQWTRSEAQRLAWEARQS